MNILDLGFFKSIQALQYKGYSRNVDQRIESVSDAYKELDSHTLRVVQGQEHPWLWAHGLVADQLSWVAGAPPSSGEGRLAAKTRYRQPDAACAWSVDDTSGHLTLVFDAAQWAVTPGQSAVLYDGEVCLGGGLIAADTGRVTAAAAS